MNKLRTFCGREDNGFHYFEWLSIKVRATRGRKSESSLLLNTAFLTLHENFKIGERMIG